MNSKFFILSFTAAAATLASAGVSSEMDGPSGIQIGPRLTLKPYVSLSYTYDSNVDSMKHSKAGSQWIVNPGMTARYLGGNWDIQGAAWYQYHAYNRYTTQLNQSSFGENLKLNWMNSAPNEKGWRLQLSEQFQQIAQDDDMSNHNGRGIGRDRKEFKADAILERRINETMHAALLGNYYLLDYDNNVDKYAWLYGWKRAVAGGEIGWAPSKWTDFILHANYQWYTQDNDYDHGLRQTDTRGKSIRSDSKGYSVMAGLATRATERITYRVLGGWSRFEYGEGVKDCNGFTYQASAKWAVDDTLHLMLLAASYYQPSEREYGNCLKVNTISLGVGKTFIPGKLSATADLSFRNESHEYSEYEEDDYDETIWTTRVGINYTLNRYAQLFGSVEYQTEETSGGGARGHEYDYDRFRGTVGVRLTY